MAERNVLDFGPEFGPEGGRMTVLPPRHGEAYHLFVPRPDTDGIAVGEHRPIEAAVPLGTNVGWNIRREGQQAGDLCSLEGSFIPFTMTKAERLAQKIPGFRSRSVIAATLASWLPSARPPRRR